MPPNEPADRLRRLLLGASGALPLSLLAGCSPAALVQALTPTDHYQRYADIAYGPDPRQRLDVYVPNATDRRRQDAPVVVFFYGGSWQRGNRALYAFVGEALAAEGFIAVLPDYRVWPEAGFPYFVEDGAHAIAWALAHAGGYGGNPRRVIAAGHSAGAHIAALLALDRHYLADAGVPDALAGMAGLAGPYDFLPLTDPKLRALFASASAPDLTQPVHFVRGDAPPLWLAHGTADRVVWPQNSEHLASRTQALGGRAELVLYDGYGHFDIVARLAAPLRGGSPLLAALAGFVREAPPARAPA